MRKQIAAANWKMNCTLEEAESLLTAFAAESFNLGANQEVVIAVPFPYLLMARKMVGNKNHFFVSAQNCYPKDFGAYTGEVSAAILQSCNITHVIIGHSERREYFGESNSFLAEKVNTALTHGLIAIFCCGEALQVRESGQQESFVEKQIQEGLFHLDEKEIQNVIIAYEPIWAIGTGKTASSDQAQRMHSFIRSTLEKKYGNEIAEGISILYGGSVKATNAKEIFSQPDVDGGLVGGASLNANEFSEIINSLKTN